MGYLASYCKDFAKDNLSPAYYSSVELSFKHLLNYIPENTIAHKIDGRTIQEFLVELKKKVPSGYAVYARTLKAFFARGVEWKFIIQNPFDTIKLQRKQRVKKKLFAPDQVSQIANRFRSESRIVMALAVELAFAVGPRINEELHLTWEEIDFENKTITFGSREYVTKTKRLRIIPFVGDCEKILKRLDKYCNWVAQKTGTEKKFVFVNANGSRMRKDNLSRNFKRICRDLRFDEEYNYHRLRHSAASYMVRHGVPLMVVSRMLGHESSAITEAVYAEMDVSGMRRCLEILGRGSYE